MARKRFHLSLSDDHGSQRLIGSNYSVIFTLTPIDVPGLYTSAYPVVWKVYDLRYGQTQIFECSEELGVGTVTKGSDRRVKPVATRIVPTGHFTALKQKFTLPYWCETRRWPSDRPQSIGLINDTHTPQAFALCTYEVADDDHEPIFWPILLYSKINNNSTKALEIKTKLRIEAFVGRGYKPSQQLQAEDRERLEPLLDESGQTWGAQVHELPIISSWSVFQRRDGRICIRNAITDEYQTYKNTLDGELKLMRKRIGGLEDTIRNVVSNDQQGVANLQKRIFELELKASELQGGFGDIQSDRDIFESNLKSVRDQVESCRKEVSELRSSRGSRATLVAGIDGIAASLDDVARLRDSIAQMEHKIQDVDATVKGVSLLEGNIDKLDKNLGHIQKYIDAVDENMVVLHRKVKQVAEDSIKLKETKMTLEFTVEGHDQELKRLRSDVQSVEERTETLEEQTESIDQATQGLDARIQKTEQGVEVAGSNIRSAVKMLQSKADIDHIDRLDAGMQRVEVVVQGVEETAGEARQSVKELAKRFDQSGTADGISVEDSRALGGVLNDLRSIQSRVGSIEEEVARIDSDTKRIDSKTVGIVQTPGENQTKTGGGWFKNAGGSAPDPVQNVDVGKITAQVLQAVEHDLTDGLNARVGEAEGQIGRMGGDIKKLISHFDDLAARMDKVGGTKVWHRGYWMS